MREIGGYFGFEELIHREYYPNLSALNTARSALLYVIKARGIKKLYIPYYLCSSVSDMLDREGCEYEFYHVGKNFVPEFSNYTQLVEGQNYLPALPDNEYILCRKLLRQNPELKSNRASITLRKYHPR